VTVGDQMSRELVTTGRGTTLRDATRRMCDRRVGSILVMDGERIAGILTERDVLRVFADGQFDATVDEVMTPHPETIEADDSLAHARVVMLHGGFRHLPVLEAGRLVGILSMRDIFGTDDAIEAPRGV
jgi:CBS domain-containing protein